MVKLGTNRPRPLRSAAIPAGLSVTLSVRRAKVLPTLVVFPGSPLYLTQVFPERAAPEMIGAKPTEI